MLRRYQYDNFHLHITIIIQITNYKSNYQIPNYKSNQIKSNIGFWERGKAEYPEKNLSEQKGESTNSAHLWRQVWELNPGHIGGRRVLAQLRQPCSPLSLQLE